MILLMVFLPMIAAAAAAASGRVSERLPYITALATVFAELGLAAALMINGGAAAVSIPLVLSYGLKFTADGFRMIYALIIAFMWATTMLLSGEYFHGHSNTTRYYFFNLMTEGAILGVFFAADLYTALVFFEIMSFTSFAWVIQEETEGAIRAACTYLAIAVIGGLCALMGIFLIEHVLGTTDIDALYMAAERTGHMKTFYAAAVCILIGFGAKAGMFPLHIWLPKAHPVAPAPASALLSGVLTKSGIFGVIAVSCGIFREDPHWGTLILVLGTITMFLGAVLALLSIDLKRTLACSSMSQIGFILIGIGCTCLLGEEGELAASGTMLHMVNHSLLKLVLFMCAGVVYMNLHELDLNRIRGFGRGKLILHICFLLGAAGIGGIPGFNGYISKTLLHEGILEAYHIYGWPLKAVEWIFLASGGLTLAYMTKLYICLFHEAPDADAEAFQEEMRGHRPAYMGTFARIALISSAVFMPLLGLTGNSLMHTIAVRASGFFHAGAFLDISFFSLENLKGAAISVIIGALVYVFIVRRSLMKDGRYINILPSWLDLEDAVYRPVLLTILPAVFGRTAAVFGENQISAPVSRGVMRASVYVSELFGENRILAPLSRAVMRVSGILSRFFGDILDALILLTGSTVLKPQMPPTTGTAENTAAYRLGSLIDRVRIREGRERPEEHRVARRMYLFMQAVLRSVHNLSDSMTTAMFMMILAVVLILIYLMFLH